MRNLTARLMDVNIRDEVREEVDFRDSSLKASYCNYWEVVAQHQIPRRRLNHISTPSNLHIKLVKYGTSNCVQDKMIYILDIERERERERETYMHM